MQTLAEMQRDLSTKTVEITVGKQIMCASILTYHSISLADDMEYARQCTALAYQKAKEEFFAHPSHEHQHSVCIISDFTPLRGQLTQKIIDTWYDHATTEDVQTQLYLYQLFQRPCFQITVVQNIDTRYVVQRQRQVNPDVPQTYFVQGMESALLLAVENLRIAHRV